MGDTEGGFGRRAFLATAAAAGSLAGTGAPPAQAAARYRRYNVTSAEGKKMLVSYARGITAMLRIPANDPRNWFRNAFVHFLDCPHGNWWFYVWHRGYVGHLEQTIRELSGDREFAFPFWDWSELPRIPDEMFDGVLTPTDAAYLPFTRDPPTFTRFIQGALQNYWKSLTPEQLAQQAQRGVTTFDDLWSGVTGGDVGNNALAATAWARYLLRQDSGLDKATTYDASRQVVLAGLAPTFFYAAGSPSQQAQSFNSIRTPNHVVQPGSATWFSVLEGLPHNNVHNYIGGAPPWSPGPFGFMTNFLSPADPVFFLHHANMDRLWDVWTRKQKALNLQFQPSDADAPAFMNEPFRFFVKSDGTYLTDGKAADYFDTNVFDYDYAPGTGEELIPGAGAPVASGPPVGRMVAEAAVRGNAGTFSLPAAPVPSHLVAAVTLRPQPGSGRAFDVLVNAPPDVAQAGPESPFFAGRISFFGPLDHHTGGGTFLVPLTNPQPQPAAGPNLIAPLARGLQAGQAVRIVVVPAGGSGPAPVVSAVVVHGF